MWQTIAAAVLAASPSCCGPPGCNHEDDVRADRARIGAAAASESQNFRVTCYSAFCDAERVAKCCEAWRTRLQATWLHKAETAAWSPRCEVVIHAHRASYTAAVGRGSEQTFGASLVNYAQQKVSVRRIDLLPDTSGGLTALAHELTHIVLAEAFSNGPPPHWANEGAGVLADSVHKQQLHDRDLRLSLYQGTAFPCAELLQMSGYPPPQRLAAFYGQSASLIAYLGKVGGHQKLLPFLHDAMQSGYDRALQKHYGISNIADLQQRWLQSI